MKRYRFLVWAGYLTAAFLIVIPAVDTLLSVSPLHGGNVTWRFGAVGMFSRALLSPLLGVFLVLAVAAVFEQRRVIRVTAVASAVVAVVFLAVLVVFALDTLQVRPQIKTESKFAFDMASLVAMAKYALGLIVFSVVAVGGWKATRVGVSGHGSEPGLLVSTQDRKGTGVGA